MLFPALSRLATRRDAAGLRALIGSGMRQISLLLIPSAAAFVALSKPITRLIYERGEFDAESTSQADRGAFWFSFSLPVSGITLLLTRNFFALQGPWAPTRLAVDLARRQCHRLGCAPPADGYGRGRLGTAVSNIVLSACSRRACCAAGSAGSSSPGRCARCC